MSDATLNPLECALDEAQALRRQVDALITENAKLRDISRLSAEYFSQDRCEGCLTKRACSAGELDECWIAEKLIDMLVEVGEQVG